MSTLPAGWAIASLSDLGMGRTDTIDPKTSADTEFELWSVPSFPSGRPEIVKGREIGASKQRVQSGDVLLCKINPRINRVWVVGERGDHDQIASTEWIVFRTDAIDPGYLAYSFREKRFRSALTANVSGVGGSLTRARPVDVARLSVPVAPLNEQRRIVAKLDALFERSRNIRDKLDRLPTLLGKLRKSILAAAMSGALTREWRDAHSDVAAWTDGVIEDVATVGTGSTPLRSNPAFYAETGTPWVTSAATGEPYVTESREFVTDEAIAAHRLKRFPVGTLLVAMYGEGKTRGQVTELSIEATINQACASVVVDESKADRRYIKLALQAKYLEMRALAEGGNQPNLNLSKVKQLPVRLPSLMEQEEIVRRTEAMLRQVSGLEAIANGQRERQVKLNSILLHKAFRGELVPQDPNDESASALLERIRAERPEKPSNKPRRSKNA